MGSVSQLFPSRAKSAVVSPAGRILHSLLNIPRTLLVSNWSKTNISTRQSLNSVRKSLKVRVLPVTTKENDSSDGGIQLSSRSGAYAHSGEIVERGAIRQVTDRGPNTFPELEGESRRSENVTTATERQYHGQKCRAEEPRTGFRGSERTAESEVPFQDFSHVLHWRGPSIVYTRNSTVALKSGDFANDRRSFVPPQFVPASDAGHRRLNLLHLRAAVLHSDVPFACRHTPGNSCPHAAPPYWFAWNTPRVLLSNC